TDSRRNISRTRKILEFLNYYRNVRECGIYTSYAKKLACSCSYGLFGS
ncbi:unnamed protein product, partial [Allacma fusca]